MLETKSKNSMSTKILSQKAPGEFTKSKPVIKSRFKCNRRPQESFKGSVPSGQIFQYFMTGDDPTLDTVTTPTKKRPQVEMDSHSPVNSDGGSVNSDDACEQNGSPRGLTISEAIDEKFSPTSFTFASFTPIAISPVKLNKDGGVKVPQILVLEDCNIWYAGDANTLCKYCGNVVELDLSRNNLQSWDEVATILRQMPLLRQLNLGQNRRLSQISNLGAFCDEPKPQSELECGGPEAECNSNNKVIGSHSDAPASNGVPIVPMPPASSTAAPTTSSDSPWSEFRHESLKTLVLIDTGAPMQTLAHLLPKLPALEELHLSLNGYKDLSDEVTELNRPHLGVKTLYFTDNELCRWNDFITLSRLFPNVHNLYIASNDLPHIDHHISLQTCFPNLLSLHMAGNKLNSWDCLDKLNELQSMKSLRMFNMSFFDTYEKDPAVRRNLCIARLKHVEFLNGSVVTADNRIDAERFFIRYYLDHEEKPKRYFDLVSKYGQLEKLGEIDLSPVDQISLKLHCPQLEIVQDMTVKPSMTVLQLKTCVSNLIGIALKDFLLFYKDPIMEESLGPVGSLCELKLMTIQLSSAGISDQNELHVRILIKRT